MPFKEMVSGTKITRNVWFPCVSNIQRSLILRKAVSLGFKWYKHWYFVGREGGGARMYWVWWKQFFYIEGILWKYPEALLVAGKEIGLEVSAEKIKRMLMFWDQRVGQNRNIKVGNKSFGSACQFIYFGTTLTNKNPIHEEMKSRSKSGNASYYSVQNLLSFSLLPKNIKIKVCRTVVCLLLCMGVQLGRSHWGTNRVLRRKAFGPKRDVITQEWRRLRNE
jgi:hypothetical protein